MRLYYLKTSDLTKHSDYEHCVALVGKEVADLQAAGINQALASDSANDCVSPGAAARRGASSETKCMACTPEQIEQ